ncbi:MAG: serine hydrolase [Frankia sp.]
MASGLIVAALMGSGVVGRVASPWIASSPIAKPAPHTAGGPAPVMELPPRRPYSPPAPAPRGAVPLPAPVLASPAASTPAPTPAFAGLAGRLRQYVASRPGEVSVAIYDAVTGRTVMVNDPTTSGWEMASTVKLSIAVALLARAGAGAQLSAGQHRLALQMISVSDNAAASQLWSSLGGAPAMGRFFARLGMTSTVPDPANQWGLTLTTAADQLAVLRAAAYPNPVLGGAGRIALDELLHTVIPGQRWGVPNGVPPGVAVEVKNGWLPYGGGWIIDSLGHVHGAGQDYVMAVYTRRNPSMQAGIDTVTGLSRLVWKALTSGSAPGPRPGSAQPSRLALPAP